MGAESVAAHARLKLTPRYEYASLRQDDIERTLVPQASLKTIAEWLAK